MTDQRTVLITGGARGIGKGIAKCFLEAGHRVMIADLETAAEPGGEWNYRLASATEMDAAVNELSGLGEVRCTPVDVTRADSCASAVAATVDAFGGIDVLINNAGIIDSGPLDTFSETQWDRIFAVNVKGIFLMTRAAVAALRASTDAAIVNTSSVSGKKGSPFIAAYAGSKFAAIGVTQSFALELARDGIRVNALCPGMVGTAMWLDHLMVNRGGAEAFEKNMSERIPLGRPQTADDMGQAAVFLATAPNVTGIALNVAGGVEMH